MTKHRKTAVFMAKRRDTGYNEKMKNKEFRDMQASVKNPKKKYLGYVYNEKEGGYEKPKPKYPRPEELTAKERQKRLWDASFCGGISFLLFFVPGCVIYGMAGFAIGLVFGTPFMVIGIVLFRYFFKKIYYDGKPVQNSHKDTEYYSGIGDMTDPANPISINSTINPLHDDNRDPFR